MSLREPWQSRSPTKGAHKPSRSSTSLGKEGPKGPHHSYGRGLPVKRKALVILTVAILALALIPALGVQAATGAVKIVTPAELANPTTDRTAAFDKLTNAPYVSDAYGEISGDMSDVYGTLYAVIEDNDATANAHQEYTAYFGSQSNQDGVSMDLDELAVDTVYPGGAKVHDHVVPTAVTAPATATPNDIGLTAVANDALVIADRNRDGVVNGNDVTVISYGVDGDGNETGKRIWPATLVFDVQEDTIWANFASMDTAATNVRVHFVTAKKDTLLYTTGSNTGKSLVSVESDTGDAITITATEKNIAGMATGITDAVDSADFENADYDSTDSGIFLARFGVIDNRWKTMLTDWVTAAEAAVATTTATATAGIVPAQTGAGTTASPYVPGTLIVPVTVDSSVTHNGTDHYVYDGNKDGVIDHKDFTVGVTWTEGTADTDTTNDPGLTVVATHLVKGGTVAADHDCSGTAADDTVVATDTLCTTISNTGVITETEDTTTVTATSKVVDSVAGLEDDLDMQATGSGDNAKTRKEVIEGIAAFAGLCSTDACPEADSLGDAVNGQANNLGASDGPAGDLVRQLLGVSDGDDIDVLYRDQSPSGTRSATSTVDLRAPTIGGLNPANDTFTTDDRFDVLFTVTDADAGLPEDAESTNFAGSGDNARNFVAVVAAARQEGGTGYNDSDASASKLDEDDEIPDGFSYELEIDANNAARLASNDNKNLEVRMTITAYDKAGNKGVANVFYTIDVIDPDLLGALTGIGVEFSSTLDRNDKGDKGAHKVLENNRRWMALVFNGPVDGSNLNPSDVAIGGQSVDDVIWLNNVGDNVVTTAANQDSGNITGTTGAGLALKAGTKGQDARHVLFVKLATDLDTTDRPQVEIDGDDIPDLAGNTSRSDHTIARATDRLAPVFTVTLDDKLSNNNLGVTIVSTEELRRSPTATVSNALGVVKRLVVRDSGENAWTVNTARSGIGLGGSGHDGIWTVNVSGEDSNGNGATNMKAKWELDTKVNNGMAPTRGGTTDAANKTQKIEVNDVVFLNVSFDAETGEYTGDSKKKVSISGLTLETLSADSVSSSGTLASSPTVEESMDLEDGTAQSSNGIKHVIALSEPALGNYRLKIDYADEAGNADDFGYVFTIVAPAPATVDVVPGWTLVSIPGTPQDKSIAGVLAGSQVTDVWSLNNETKIWEFARIDDEGEWTGTLSQIVDGRGYFVRSTTFDPISVLLERFSPQRTPPQYIVATGWNSIGYTPAGNEDSVSVDGYLSALGTSGWGMIRMWNSDATPPQYETYFSSGAMTDGFPNDNGVAKVEKGKGYLLFATRNGVIGG